MLYHLGKSSQSWTCLGFYCGTLLWIFYSDGFMQSPICYVYKTLKSGFFSCLHSWYLNCRGILHCKSCLLLIYYECYYSYCIMNNYFFSLFMAESQPHTEIWFSQLYDSLHGRRIPNDSWCEVTNFLKPLFHCIMFKALVLISVHIWGPLISSLLSCKHHFWNYFC